MSDLKAIIEIAAITLMTGYDHWDAIVAIIDRPPLPPSEAPCST